MQQIVLVVHLMLALGLVGTVLLQRSEGGGLGIGGGGGGGGGGLMDARSTANFLTRATAVLAGLFFLTSIGLAVMAGTPSGGGGNRSLVTDGAPIGGAAPAPMGAAPHDAGGDAAPAADVELPVLPSVPTN